MKGIVYFMFLCMCCACRYGDTAVEEALMLAGKNRGELEAVLEYYREDSFKSRRISHWKHARPLFVCRHGFGKPLL